MYACLLFLVSLCWIDFNAESISSTAGSISEPGRSAPQVAECLQKAGIEDLGLDDNTVSQSDEVANRQGNASGSKIPPQTVNQNRLEIIQNASASSISSSLAANGGEDVSRPLKSVSFAEGTKEGDKSTQKFQIANSTKSEGNGAKATETSNNDTAATGNTAETIKRNILVYDEDDDKPFHAVIPDDESPEDAALRREMIQYNMGEVGAIVAELKLNEDDDDSIERDDEEDDYENSSVEEEEDQFGRSSGRVLTDDYLAEMQKLQQRLTNIGPVTAQSTTPTENDGIIREEHSKSTASKGLTQRSRAPLQKGVRFAEKLDIQEAPTKSGPTTPSHQSVDGVKTAVPSKSTHAPTVVERPYSATTSSRPFEPDECDQTLIRQEVRTEYHRMRNHLIQRQDGFRSPQEENEDGEVAITEAEVAPKKISRFKAARLGKLGT